MADLAADIYATLSPVGMVYFRQLPQNFSAYPAMTYDVISRLPEKHMGGWDTLGDARFVIHVWAETLASAATLAGAAKTALDGIGATLNDDIPDYDETSGLFRRILDFQLIHQEA